MSLNRILFFNDTPYYLVRDLVLTVMSAACLPGAISIYVGKKGNKICRDKCFEMVQRSRLCWFSILADCSCSYIECPCNLVVAWQSCFMLRLCGLNDVHLGETYVDTGSSTVLWSEWEGNMVMTETYGNTLHRVGARWWWIYCINFILAFSAIQSWWFCQCHRSFRSWWKKGNNALLISLPIIHILNLFRNAGLIWLYHLRHWDFYGLTVFEFGHACTELYPWERCFSWHWLCLNFFLRCTNMSWHLVELSVGSPINQHVPKNNHCFLFPTCFQNRRPFNTFRTSRYHS